MTLYESIPMKLSEIVNTVGEPTSAEGRTTGDRRGNNEFVDRIIEVAASWEHVLLSRGDPSVLRVGPTEIGHVHRQGFVDIAFPRPLRNQLIFEGKASAHHVYPTLAWVTIHGELADGTNEALWLLRLSYLYHASRFQRTPASTRWGVSGIDIETELQRLGPSDDLQMLFKRFVRVR